MFSASSNLSLFNVVFKIVLLALPLWSWTSFFKTWRDLHKNYNEKKLHYERHNCVVMFNGSHGIAGWPGPKIPRSGYFGEHYVPILYFINTAEKSLYIATMILDSVLISNSIIDAHKRGVKVLLLTDFFYFRGSKQLAEAGIPVVYFIGEDRMNNIFHQKYMVKDYTGDSGFLCMGSLNMTSGALQRNFENLLFTSNIETVKQYHEEFEKSWETINDLNKNSFNRTQLASVMNLS